MHCKSVWIKVSAKCKIKIRKKGYPSVLKENLTRITSINKHTPLYKRAL